MFDSFSNTRPLLYSSATEEKVEELLVFKLVMIGLELSHNELQQEACVNLASLKTEFSLGRFLEK